MADQFKKIYRVSKSSCPSFMNISQLNQEKEEHFYILTKTKYKLCNDLSIYEKKMVESTFMEILNKKQKYDNWMCL